MVFSPYRFRLPDGLELRPSGSLPQLWTPTGQEHAGSVGGLGSKQARPQTRYADDASSVSWRQERGATPDVASRPGRGYSHETVRAVIDVDRQGRGGTGLPQPSDPRRRRGRHAEARRLLAQDGGPASALPGVWTGLLTALRRHTIQSSLAALDEGQRHLLRMAYVEGRSNREIAATLSVSASTARRRISAALARVEEQLRRTGTLVSTILLALLAFPAGRARVIGRSIDAFRATPAGNAVLVAGAGVAATAVVVGAVLTSQGTAAGDRASSGPLTNVTTRAAMGLVPLAQLLPPTDTISTSTAPPGHATGSDGAAAGPSGKVSGSLDPGCDGNPTSAAPVIPVGPRGKHPTTVAPVTHPAAGGCGPNGAEAQ
jgi:hypothetical protein